MQAGEEADTGSQRTSTGSRCRRERDAGYALRGDSRAGRRWWIAEQKLRMVEEAGWQPAQQKRLVVPGRRVSDGAAGGCFRRRGGLATGATGGSFRKRGGLAPYRLGSPASGICVGTPQRDWIDMLRIHRVLRLPMGCWAYPWGAALKPALQGRVLAEGAVGAGCLVWVEF